MTTNSSTTTGNATGDLPALAEESIKQAVQVVIAVFGVVGNTLVCLVMRRLSRRFSGTDLNIQALAIADLLVLSVNFPMAVIKEKLPTNWPFGEFVCLYIYPIPETFYGASVWTIVAIAVERYRGIVQGAPVKGKPVLTRVKKTLACLWAVSFLVFSLPLYFFMMYEEKSTWKMCDLNWPPDLKLFKVYTILLMLCSYVLPLVFICWTFIKITRTLDKSSSFIKTMFDGKDVTVTDHVSQTERNRLHGNKRANKILTPVVVLFTISMLPLTLLRTVIPFWLALVSKPFYSKLIYVASLGAIINSAANPLIYSVSCRDFRIELKRLLCKTSRRRGLSVLSTGSGITTL